MKKLFKRIFNPDGKSMTSDENEMIEKLILEGGLEVAGIDSEDGSLLYSFTPKIKQLMPELYDDHMNAVNAEILSLWERGYVDIDFLSKDPVVTLALKSFDKTEMSKLTKREKWSIEELKRLSGVMGCHKTRGQAAAQIYAINRSEGNIGKSMVKEGDMVMAPNDDEVYVGRVVHVMTEGMLGFPGSEYALAASATEPAVLIQLFEMEEGGLEETEYFIGKKASEVMAMPSLESNAWYERKRRTYGS